MPHPGSLVLEARERLGLTKADLAERSGVDRTYISRIEAGRKPGSIEAVVKLAKVLDIDLNLLKFDETASTETAPVAP